MIRGSTISKIYKLALAPVVLVSISISASAQELEPRLFQNLPVGANIVSIAYVHSRGNVLFDPTLPIEDAEAQVNSAVLRYTRSLNVAGKSGRFEAIVPYVTGHWEGLLEGEFAETDRDDFADARLRFVVNFLGAPALRGSEYAAYRQKTIVGASVQLIVPTGEYDGERIINLGSNRFTVRTQIGASRALGNWTFEVAGTAWLFGTNDDAMGETLKQDPLFALQGHVLYRFRNRIALGVNAGFADGGKSEVGGATRSALEKNSRAGVTLSLPLGRKQALTLAFAAGVTARVGTDFNNYVVAYSYLWGV